MLGPHHGSRLAAALLASTLFAGLGIAGYLVAHHENQVYGDASLALANCPETETVNCDLVNSSPWSEIAGLPIAALAIPTYLLLLGLLAAAPRAQATLAYAFCIGLACALYSAVLLVISKTLIGYLCLWCMRLYAVNVAIPVLAAIAARRTPWALMASTVRDLRTWPRPLRRTAIAFVALLALTIAGDQALRSHARAVAAEERARIERTTKVVLGSAENGKRFQSRTLANAEEAEAYVNREWQPEKVRARYDWLFTYDVTAVAV